MIPAFDAVFSCLFIWVSFGLCDCLMQLLGCNFPVIMTEFGGFFLLSQVVMSRTCLSEEVFGSVHAWNFGSLGQSMSKTPKDFQTRCSNLAVLTTFNECTVYMLVIADHCWTLSSLIISLWNGHSWAEDVIMPIWCHLWEFKVTTHEPCMKHFRIHGGLALLANFNFTIIIIIALWLVLHDAEISIQFQCPQLLLGCLCPVFVFHFFLVIAIHISELTSALYMPLAAS